MRWVALAVTIAIAAIPCSPQATRPVATGARATERLGEVKFPTSCSPSVQSLMANGLALLHSFQYDEAEKAFTDAAREDSLCALAYWGKAMALYQQLWNFPDARTLAAGQQDVEQAQKLAQKTIANASISTPQPHFIIALS